MLGLLLAPCGAVNAPDQTGWQLLTQARPREALAAFRADESRAARLGEALALLNLNPKTAGNVDAARELVTALAAGDPDDRWTVHAKWQLGRIAELHANPADTAEACRHYQRVFTDHPDTELADTARVRFVLLQLYEPVGRDEIARRLATFESFAAHVKTPPARRDFHLVMADACFFHALDPATALRHTIAAHELGIEQPARELTLIVRIAELSRELGQREQAIAYYRRYLAAAQLDNRAQLIRERLATLEAHSAATPR